MAQLPSVFNSTEQEKLGDFRAIPAGDYLAHIKESSIKPTKNGDGSYVQLNFEILEGPHMKRVLFCRLNLQNQNEQAVKIAEKTLASICECAGVPIIKDTEELHGRPMYISVVVKEKTAQYAESNDIKGFSPATGAAPIPQSTPTAAATKATPPWIKK